MTNNKKISSLAVEFNKDGKYTVAKSFDSTGKMDSYFDGITTNEFGEITGATQHRADSTLQMSFTTTYDKHLFVGNESKDSAGKVTYRSSEKLNDKNDQEQLTETNINKDSTTTTVTNYKYDGFDEQGHWTQGRTYDDKGKTTRIIKRTITYSRSKNSFKLFVQ